MPPLGGPFSRAFSAGDPELFGKYPGVGKLVVGRVSRD